MTQSHQIRRRQLTSVSSRRPTLESLELRQMFSGTPISGPAIFDVINDAAANVSYQYSATSTAQGSTPLASLNTAPRGIASSIAADKNWVIDANRNVYVYDGGGALLGSWSAGSLASNATPEGIATDGNDVWIVDGRSDRVYRYAGAANRVAGAQTAASSFQLSSANTNPKDMVTDGASIWVVNDGAKSDKVFKYSNTGSLLGSWTIDSANKTPTGIAIDPANVGDMLIVDSGTDRVYRYAGATARNSGSQAASASSALASGNSNPQGIAVDGRPWAEAPHEVSWVRQLGTAADDWGRGVSVDGTGNVYLSGAGYSSLTAPGATTSMTPFLAKFNSDGVQDWLQQANPVPGVNYEGVRAATDASGNVFQVISIGSDGSSASLKSFDSAGAVRWTAYLPAGEYVFSVATDHLGGAYISSYEGSNIHVRKFDGSTGALLWEQALNTGGYTNSSGISADHLGNVYVAAYTDGALIGPNAGGYDVVLAKYSDAGVLIWAKQFGSAAIDYGFMVEADRFGNVYTSGQTFGSLDGLNAGDKDNFLAKHDAAGNLLWMRQWGTSGAESNSGSWIDPLSNVYRAMTTSGALGGVHHGGKDIVVVKYDPSGNLMWATQLGTAGVELASGGISGDNEGNLYIAGRTTGSLEGTNAGGVDAVLIKLSPPAAAVGAVSSDSQEYAALRSSEVIASSLVTGLDGAIDRGRSDADLARRSSFTDPLRRRTLENVLTSFSVSSRYAGEPRVSGQVEAQRVQKHASPNQSSVWDKAFAELAIEEMASLRLPSQA